MELKRRLVVENCVVLWYLIKRLVNANQQMNGGIRYE